MLLPLLAAALLLSSSALASAQQTCPSPRLLIGDLADPAIAANDRRLLAETDHILRLPDEERARQIAHVYRDIFAVLHPHWYPLANWSVVVPYGGLEDLEARPGFTVPDFYASMYAQQASLALLAAYPSEAQPLIQRDLRSNNIEDLERGMFVAGTMTEARLPHLYDDLKDIFLRGRECSDEALGHLFRYVGFSRDSTDTRQARLREFLPVLVAKFQRDPEKYTRYLEELLSVGPAPAELIADLESDDSMLRERASLALSQNTDPRLVPYVLAMLSDPNPSIRLRGFQMGGAGLRRNDVGFRGIKPALQSLMRDPDWMVQLRVLEDFAFAGDPACAPVLLEVLRKWAAGDPSVPPLDLAQLAALAEAIAHQKFGFGDGRLPAHDDPATRLAIDRFSDWVKAQ